MGLLSLIPFKKICNVGMETYCGFAPCLLIVRECLHTPKQALVSRSIFTVT